MPGVRRKVTHRTLRIDVGDAEERWRFVLFLLLDVQRMFAKARRVLLELQFLATRAASQGVVIVAGFFTHEENRFQLSF